MHTGWFCKRQRRTYNILTHTIGKSRRKWEEIQQIRFYWKLHFKYHFLLASFRKRKRRRRRRRWKKKKKKIGPFSIPFGLHGLLYQLIRKSVRSWLKIKIDESTFSTELSFILFVYFISYFDPTNLLFNIAFDNFQFLVILLWNRLISFIRRIVCWSDWCENLVCMLGFCFQPWFISMK